MTLGTSKHRTILTICTRLVLSFCCSCMLIYAAKEGLPRARTVPPAKRGDAIDRNWHNGVHPFTGQVLDVDGWRKFSLRHGKWQETIEEMDQTVTSVGTSVFFLKYVGWFECWTYGCSEFQPMPRTWMSNWPICVWMIQMLGAGKRCLWKSEVMETHLCSDGAN